MANASSAKQQHDYGCTPSNFAAVNNTTTNPCDDPCGGWRYNPWFGVYTHIPCGGNVYSPYGYRYWNPYNVMQAYYAPPPIYNHGPGYGGNNGYSGMPQTSSGYSGAMSTAASTVSSPTAAASSSTSTSSSAGSASSGHGSAGGHH